MTPIIPGLPNLPPEPSGAQDLLRWASAFKRATSDLYRILSGRIEQMILEGTLAERPAANNTRRFYWVPNFLDTTPTTGTLYYDDGQWVPVAVGTGGGGTPFDLTVKEVDGVPTVSDVNVIRFNQDDGFEVLDDGGGQVTINLTVPPQPSTLIVREVDLSPTIDPTLTLEFDQADGFIVTDQGSGVARVNLDVVAAGCPPAPEVPGGYIDGINREFVLSETPPCGGFLTRNRVYMVEGCDYDRAGDTITYVLGNSPLPGSCHVWTYL